MSGDSKATALPPRLKTGTSQEQPPRSGITRQGSRPFAGGRS